MSAEAIFLFTGKAIWMGLCAAALLAVVSSVIAAPIYVFYRARRILWQWVLATRLMREGFSEADIRFAFSITGGGLPCKFDDFIEAVKRIKERGDALPLGHTGNIRRNLSDMTEILSTSAAPK